MCFEQMNAKDVESINEVVTFCPPFQGLIPKEMALSIKMSVELVETGLSNQLLFYPSTSNN